MKKDIVINAETAEEIFEEWVEAMDIDIDVTEADEDEIKVFKAAKRRIVKAIMVGAATLNDNSEIVYTPQHPRAKHKDPITFHERTGASVMAMDSRKKGHDIAKTFAVMADLAKVSVATIAGLIGVDSKTTQAIFVLLMD